VANRAKGRGRDLLRDAPARVAQAGELVGARAVLVHAIDDDARRFYLHFGFTESPVDPFQLMMLMKDLRASL
jgi:GNAT superfamily N-acetyltransferase